MCYSPTPHQAHNTNNYGRALLSAPPQAIAPNPHTNLLNVYIELANKMGFKQNKTKTRWSAKVQNCNRIEMSDSSRDRYSLTTYVKKVSRHVFFEYLC
jgi:hypothetical protein